MKKNVETELGLISYEENFWTGIKSLSINGESLTKIDKTHYAYKAHDEFLTIELKGNSYLGVSISFKDKKIQIIENPAWYVLAISILTFLFVIVWGSSVTLCKIFPIVGGAIGGAISAVCAVSSVMVASKIKKPIMKILSSLGFFALCVLLCYLVALIIISMA